LEETMRLPNWLVRLPILLTLIAASAVLGGWKWDIWPH
jgi:hypothetical protein